MHRKLLDKFSHIFLKKTNLTNLNKNIDTNKNYIISMSSGSTSKPKPIIFSQKTKIIRYKLFRNLYKINFKR
jgi:phenylacetate-coenzyme A ligase PaaK-like adenylate-forming protein